ncbi:hypothetical protein AAMO2058_001654100 [Amorphochlora amoebiformis]
MTTEASKALKLAEESQFKCVVCMEPYTDAVTTPCNHTYCRYCIAIVILQEQAKSRTAKGSQDKNTSGPKCPMCRKAMNGQLQTNHDIDAIMVKSKAWGDADIYYAKCCVVYDADIDKEKNLSSTFRFVVDNEGSFVCDVMWNKSNSTRQNAITRLQGTWDTKTGLLDAKAFTTSWQADIDSQWARYKPQHAKGAFQRMNFKASEERKVVPWEAWTGILKDVGNGSFQLHEGRFEPKDVSGRESGGVILMRIQQSTAFREEDFNKYIDKESPQKEERSFLSSFLAAPSKAKDKKNQTRGGLAFARLWSHSSPDPSGFAGETV